MPKVLTFDTGDRIPGGADLRFLRAEVPNVADPPVALIRYSVGGQEPETGLRLDLDKQVFLDHFEEGSDREEALLRAAPLLISFVYAKLDRRDGLEPDERYKPPTPECEQEGVVPVAALPRIA